MKVIFLGTGTSVGVPQLGCTCKTCTSTNTKDFRQRSSVLVQTDDGNTLLIDCGPDFWHQMQKRYKPIDGVLITHEHSDHVGGLDDLRPFCINGKINIYAEANVCRSLYSRMQYCFSNNPYPGVPKLELQEITLKSFSIKETKIQPIRVIHGSLHILGYRIGNMTYITDMSSIDHSELTKIKGTKILIINALRHTYHPSHQTLEEALEIIKTIAPEKAYITHMCHDMGLHEEEEKKLPKNVYFAYDNLGVNI